MGGVDVPAATSTCTSRNVRLEDCPPPLCSSVWHSFIIASVTHGTTRGGVGHQALMSADEYARAHAHTPTLVHTRAHVTRHRQEHRWLPPLATHSEDGRRQPPPPLTGMLTGRGRSAVPGLARANHHGPYQTPTLPTRLPHISAGGQEFEEWDAGEVGGRKKGLGQI